MFEPKKKNNEYVIREKPMCDIKTKEALSAIMRAKTNQCKNEIVNITCLSQSNKLFPRELPRSCPLAGKNI